MKGKASCTEQDGSSLYSLRLSSDDLSETAHTTLPASAELDVGYTDGTLEILVRDDTIETIRLSCNGTLHLLFTDAPVSFSCELGVEEQSFTLPDAVADAIAREK